MTAIFKRKYKAGCGLHLNCHNGVIRNKLNFPDIFWCVSQYEAQTKSVVTEMKHKDGQTNAEKKSLHNAIILCTSGQANAYITLVISE